MDIALIAEVLLALIAIAKIINGFFKIEKADSIIEAIEKVLGELISVFKVEINSKKDTK